MFAELPWKALLQLINRSIAEVVDEQQMLDVVRLRRRLHEMAECETDEDLVLCYWLAGRVLMRLPPTLSVKEFRTVVREALRAPLNHDRF